MAIGNILAALQSKDSEKIDVGQLLQLLALLAPLLTQKPADPKPDLEPEPDLGEPIPPPPGFEEPPPDRVEAVRGVLEVRWFIHERTGSIFYPDHAVKDGERVEDGGRGFWDRMTGRTRLNVRTRINVTPTFYDAQDHELDGAAWTANGWSYNLRYGADLNGSKTIGYGDGTPDTEITLDPKDAAVNVGGAQYRAGKGRAAELNVFEEGKLTLWAETPDGQKTEPRVFIVA